MEVTEEYQLKYVNTPYCLNPAYGTKTEHNSYCKNILEGQVGACVQVTNVLVALIDSLKKIMCPHEHRETYCTFLGSIFMCAFISVLKLSYEKMWVPRQIWHHKLSIPPGQS
jgi:hypothetical protein